MAMIEEHQFIASYHPFSHPYPTHMSTINNTNNNSFIPSPSSLSPPSQHLTLHSDPMLSDPRLDRASPLFASFSQVGLGMGMGMFEGNALGLKNVGGYESSQQQQHRQQRQHQEVKVGREVMFGDADVEAGLGIGMGMGIDMGMSMGMEMGMMTENDSFTTDIDPIPFNDDMLLSTTTETKPTKPSTKTPPLIPYNTPPLSTYDGSPSIPASFVTGEGEGEGSVTYSPETMLSNIDGDESYYYDQYEIDHQHQQPQQQHYRQTTYPGTFLPAYLYDDYIADAHAHAHGHNHNHHPDYYSDGFSEREEPSLPTTPRISVSSAMNMGVNVDVNNGGGGGMSKSRSCPSLFDTTQTSSSSFDPRLFSQSTLPNQDPSDSPSSEPIKQPPQGPRIYRCRQSPTCTKAYGTGAGLRYHLRHFHKLTVIPRQPPVRIARIKPDFYECLRCGKRYGTAAGLRDQTGFL